MQLENLQSQTSDWSGAQSWNVHIWTEHPWLVMDNMIEFGFISDLVVLISNPVIYKGAWFPPEIYHDRVYGADLSNVSKYVKDIVSTHNMQRASYILILFNCFYPLLLNIFLIFAQHFCFFSDHLQLSKRSMFVDIKWP